MYSPEMAIRLSKAFGGSAESWILQQAQYDLWQALQKYDELEVKSFLPADERVYKRNWKFEIGNYTAPTYLYQDSVVEIKGQSVFVSKTKIGSVYQISYKNSLSKLRSLDLDCSLIHHSTLDVRCSMFIPPGCLTDHRPPTTGCDRKR